MSTALAVGNGTMALSDVREIARAAASSGLFPALKSPDAVLTLMMLAQAEGLHPIQALRRFDIVQGKVGMKADAMLGEFQMRGGTVEWHEWDDTKCSATFEAPGVKNPRRVEWTIERAKAAGLAAKQTWQQYPRNMLRARTISDGIRMTMPAVVVGLYAPEEIQDFARPVAAVVEATPIPKAVEAVVTAPTPITPSTDAPSEAPTPNEVKELNIALKPIVGDDRLGKLGWLSARTGREIASSKSLSRRECLDMIAQARKEAAKMQEREPGAEG